mgnify:CR=1 FL=1
MKSKAVVGLLFAVLVIGGISYSAWCYVAERETHFCKACSRPIHQHSRTVALVDGKRRVYCCPVCALTEHRQSGKPVEVIEVANHLGAKALRPADTYVVRNSNVNLCQRHDPTVSPDKQPMRAHFDRCSPSILVFASRAAAQEFSREHGGQVLRFADLASQYQR